ncbi:hypothetical protein GCM10007290_35370 [Providencia stuartii]|nr:hypothetical protein AFL46_12230 [Providencia stuartii]GHC03847.1 hypothetical protein GCM10007290_35370 [Providencia thailandensis]MTC12291.1 hypothetical protein [Providencia stuartii]HEM7145831.1 hypothetical protein [Providencia stuartii]HEM7168266.1 hypothetical protein [Providencia stuartii]
MGLMIMEQNTTLFDEDEMEQISTLASSILPPSELAEWNSLLQKAIHHPDDVLEDEKYSNYSDLEAVFDEDDDDRLQLLFDIFCHSHNIVVAIDWRGEDDDDQLITFLSQRISRFDPTLEKEQLFKTLKEHVDNSELENEEFESSTDYFAEKFSLLQDFIEKYGYKMWVLHVDYDSYPIFIASIENNSVIETEMFMDFIPN